MKLTFKGEVTTGDPYRVQSDSECGAIHVGGVDVVDEIAEQKFGSASVLCNGERIASGCCVSDLGWGYSSWTPMETDTLAVGGFDLIGFLEDKAGQSVELVITDEE